MILATVLAMVQWARTPMESGWEITPSRIQILADDVCEPFLTLRFHNTMTHTGSEDFLLYGVVFRIEKDYDRTHDEVVWVLSEEVSLQTKEKAPLEHLRVPEETEGYACLVMPMS